MLQKSIRAEKAVLWSVIVIHSFMGLLYWISHMRTKEIGVPVAYGEKCLSNRAELIMCMCVATVLGVIIISFLWHGIWYGVRYAKKELFIVIFISVAMAILITPFNYSLEIDNAGLYAYAVRGLADYWNGFYQTMIYQSCLIAFYHPASLTAFQVASFLCVILYLQKRIYRLYGKKWDKLIWLVLLFPSTLEVMVNPYRNNINTIIDLMIVGFLVLDYLEKKERLKKEQILLAVVLGVVGAYRTENVFLIVLCLVTLVKAYKSSIKNTIIWLCVFIISFTVALFPQKLGDAKYYQKDYMVINQMNTVRYIMQDEKFNNAYDGCGEDLLTIHEFADLEAVYQGGLDGYRARRYEAIGNANQSLKSAEEQNDFMKACRSLYWHNLSLYLKERYETFLESGAFHYRKKIVDDQTTAFYDIVMKQFAQNYEEINRDCSRLGLWRVHEREYIAEKLLACMKQYSSIFYNFYIWAFLRVTCIVMFIASCVLYAKGAAEDGMWLSLGCAVSVFMVCLSVFMFEPEGRRGYLTTVCYVMCLAWYVMTMERIKHKNH